MGRTVARLGELVAWGRSLDQVTAIWWHTSQGNLHITITGSTGGVRLRAYGGVSYTDVADLVNLAPDDSAAIALDELVALLDLLGESMAGMA